ncbi:hypothetical protein AMS68_001940 [Peltaster fructicola]|uniref:Major facilitator superfamily (MFS) profile domain-containing protein n=1 Tax=Peltaster fructicola TaxID=286661 RepID=A0A6H0XNY1_9PEZI|nr:hypothetical protein AMS68_001940 [Peltaster fructicola]
MAGIPGDIWLNRSASAITSKSVDGTDNDGPTNTAPSVEILRFEGHHSKYNPVRWTKSRKWLVTGIALLGTLLLPLNGTSITVAAGQINADFGVSDADFPNSYWVVTSWSVGGGIFIIFFLPLMEDLGVKAGYIIVYIVFYCMVIGQAVAQNYATLIVTRFFSGGCVALLANTISSMIPDVWETDEERSVPVGIYILFYVVGSTLGPVAFAPVMQYLNDWRWIFYIQLIVYGVVGPVAFLLIRETRGSVILRRHAKKIRTETDKEVWAEAELANTLFGTVFLFTQSTTQVFDNLYDWQEYSSGYVQGAIVIGEILGWAATFYSTRVYLQSKYRNTEMLGTPIPEARLYVSIPASFIGLAGGMFVYAWTSYPSLPWIAPAIGLGMVGFGIQVVISAVADYVFDAYAVSAYAGSAVSAVAFGENIVAGFLPLATQSMYTNLGLQWASTLLAFIGVGLSMIPIIFVWKGRWLRAKSPYMQG